MAHPIWKDYIISETTADIVNFQISYNNTQIYSGKAYRAPNADAIEIKINDICADFIRNIFPDNFPNTGSEAQDYIYTFRVDMQLEGESVIFPSRTAFIEFLYDWSFDYSRDYTTTPILLAPIIREIPRNAPLIYSSTSGENYIEIVDKGSFSRAFNSAFDVAKKQFVNGQSVANNVFNLADLTTINDTDVVIQGGTGSAPISYRLIAPCKCRYMLYFLNAYGGWDFMPIEGKDKQTDNYTRHTLGQTYNNDQARNRGTRNYRNDIAREWELHTLWIDDAGAQNMHHLLGSTDVYLYDLQTEQLYPVTIANTSCEYKTYSNNGNQLVRYDIRATLAKILTRR